MKYLTKKQKKMLRRIVIAAVVFAALFLLPERGFALSWLRAVLYLIPYTIVGWDVLWKALRNIRAGQVFDENFLMAVATVGAFGAGEYPEAVAVMLFYQVGELFQGAAVGRSRRSIAALMDIRPDYANIERDGALVQVDPEEVKIGDIIVDLDASGDLERKLSVSNGTGKARVNGRVVRIGYFGSGQAAALCEQLSAILRGESGVAN